MALTRSARRALLAGAIGLVAALAGYGVANWLRPPGDIPSTATDFALPDLSGQTHSLAAHRGKLLLLNFWATWCPPCRHEIPGFIRLQGRYQAQGLQILGISIDNPEAVARYWQEMQINYPLLLADDSVFELMTAYGNGKGGLPYSVLIRPDGQIAATKLGAYEEKELETLLKPLLPTENPGKN
jgi:peroxiredoxin